MLSFRRNCLVVAAAMALAGGCTFADTISSGNSTVTINPADTSVPYAPLITQWTVDGQNQFGTESGAGEEVFINPGGAGGFVNLQKLLEAGPTESAGSFTATYGQAGGITCQIQINLTGGANGSGDSSLQESFAITNNAKSSFTLGVPVNFQATVGGDTTNTLTANSSTTPTTFTQTDSSGAKLTVVYSPASTSWDTYDVGSDLTNGEDPGPITGEVGFYGGWAQTINPGQTLMFSVDATISGVQGTNLPPGGPGPGAAVPLPSAAASSMSMLAALGIWAWGKGRGKARWHERT